MGVIPAVVLGILLGCLVGKSDDLFEACSIVFVACLLCFCISQA